jgi:hypothetical protein
MAPSQTRNWCRFECLVRRSLHRVTGRMILGLWLALDRATNRRSPVKSPSARSSGSTCCSPLWRSASGLVPWVIPLLRTPAGLAGMALFSPARRTADASTLPRLRRSIISRAEASALLERAFRTLYPAKPMLTAPGAREPLAARAAPPYEVLTTAGACYQEGPRPPLISARSRSQ